MGLLQDSVLQALARALGTHYSSEKATVANLGLESKDHYNELLGRWITEAEGDAPGLPVPIELERMTGPFAALLAPPQSYAPPKKRPCASSPDTTSALATLPQARRDVSATAVAVARLEKCESERDDTTPYSSIASSPVPRLQPYRNVLNLCEESAAVRLSLTMVRRAQSCEGARGGAQSLRLLRLEQLTPEWASSAPGFGDAFDRLARHGDADWAILASPMFELWASNLSADGADRFIRGGGLEQVLEAMRTRSVCAELQTVACGMFVTRSWRVSSRRSSATRGTQSCSRWVVGHFTWSRLYRIRDANLPTAAARWHDLPSARQLQLSGAGVCRRFLITSSI